MIHPIYRATFCRALSAYKLELHFNDGESRIVDLEPVLAGALYGPLRDQAVFSQVRLDEETGVPVWPNGADFDPAILHDWNLHLPNFVKAADNWRRQAATAA
ncbi:MAG: DUF2442 domain-containing protein [Verrucomicrobiae bacterium]